MRPRVVGALTAALVLGLVPPAVIILPDVLTPSAREVTPPSGPSIDLTLLWVMTTVEWRRTPQLVTPEEVRTDASLWVRMLFRDWDRVPQPLRDEGLDAMLGRFGKLRDAPSRWRRMGAPDWDRVPPPIRAMAFMTMAQRWACDCHLGEAQGLEPDVVATRLKAILMAESWFDHRATSLNPDGSRDVGLAQLTDYARRRIRRHGELGWTDFTLAEDDYFEPLSATRALAYWFGLMLQETSGDLDLATRAYNVGIGEALRGRGEEYLANVERVQRTYIQDRAPSPSWRYLLARTPSFYRGCPPRSRAARPDRSRRPASLTNGTMRSAASWTDETTKRLTPSSIWWRMPPRSPPRPPHPSPWPPSPSGRSPPAATSGG